MRDAKTPKAPCYCLRTWSSCSMISATGSWCASSRTSFHRRAHSGRWRRACEAVAKATTIGSLAEQPAVDGVHVLSGVDDGSSRNRLPRRKGRAKTALMNCPRLASATSASAFGVRFLLRSIADPLYQSYRLHSGGLTRKTARRYSHYVLHFGGQNGRVGSKMLGSKMPRRARA